MQLNPDFTVSISVGPGREYYVTPGITTVSTFMKEYGLIGTLLRGDKAINSDATVIDDMMSDSASTAFTIEDEKSMAALFIQSY